MKLLCWANKLERKMEKMKILWKNVFLIQKVLSGGYWFPEINELFSDEDKLTALIPCVFNGQEYGILFGVVDYRYF